MALTPEDAFDGALKQWPEGVTRGGEFTRAYHRRKDVADIEPAELREFLSNIKSRMNEWLAGRKRVPEHLDDRDFHFDYIDSDFLNALAFRDDTYAFIGVTLPMVHGMIALCASLSENPQIRAMLDLGDECADNLKAVFFDGLFYLVVSHEFSHHVHGHVVEESGSIKLFSEYDPNGKNGSMQKQADEADADGYSTYHVLSNIINGSFREHAVQSLGLSSRPKEIIDQTLFLSLMIVACAHLTERNLIDVRKADVFTESHPLQATRLDYLLRHGKLWCEAYCKHLLPWATPERFRLVLQIIGGEMWGIESHGPWAEQIRFLQSDEGKRYMEEMTRLIDNQKARLREISWEKEAAAGNPVSPTKFRATDYIDDLRIKDDENYAQISNIFRTEVDLINELLELYELCGIALRPHLKDSGDRIAGALIYGIGRNHLVRGALSLCRAYAAPMFRETRSAAEAAGMAFSVMKHKDMREVLLADVGTPETREAMKKTFTQKRIFPKDRKTFRQLNDDYDYCSWRAHTNMVAFSTHLGRTDDGQAAFQVQDFRSGTATGEMALYFIHLLLSHLHILTSVDESFDHFDVTDKLEEFMATRDAFTTRLMEMIWKWRGQHILEKLEDAEWLKNATEKD